MKNILCVCVCLKEHHRTKMVCENKRLRLACKNDTVLAIYSASFGHQPHWNHDCPQETDIEADMGLVLNSYNTAIVWSNAVVCLFIDNVVHPTFSKCFV